MSLDFFEHHQIKLFLPSGVVEIIPRTVLQNSRGDCQGPGHVPVFSSSNKPKFFYISGTGLLNVTTSSGIPLFKACQYSEMTRGPLTSSSLDGVGSSG